MEFRLEGSTAPQVFVIEVTDRGSGINNLTDALDADYPSPTAWGWASSAPAV